MQDQAKQHVPILNLLRALASLGVCAVHIQYFVGLNEYPLSNIISYGQLGVAIFFIISGFVIPYSLWNKNYTIKDFFPYILKRSVRIDPPYLVIILICFLLGYKFEIVKVICHLLYLIPFTNYNWYQSVFWTLGVEFQFYIIIGLCFTFIKNGKLYILLPLLLAIAFIGYFITAKRSDNFIFQYIHYFIFGMIVLLHKKNRMSIMLTQFLLVVLTAYLCIRISIATGMIGFLISQVIIYLNFQTKITNFLGNISYSLYLTHTLTGTIILGLLKNEHINSYFLYFLIMIVCIAVATVFFYAVEKVALKWSKSI